MAMWRGIGLTFGQRRHVERKRVGLCARCDQDGWIALPSARGWRLLCWEHYCEEVRPLIERGRHRK